MSHSSAPFKFLRWCLGITLVVLLGLTEGLAEESYPKRIEFQLAEKASFFLPNSLKKILLRRQKSLLEGIDSLNMDPFMSPLGRSRLESSLLERAQAVVRALSYRPRFSEVVFDFGALAPMILYLNLPEGERLTKDDFHSLCRYGERNSFYFPLVAYESASKVEEPDFLQDILREIRLRRERLSAKFLQAYPGILSEASSDRANPQSSLFGVSSLVYSHSINDLTRIWLWAWRSAHGDMVGTPDLP